VKILALIDLVPGQRLEDVRAELAQELAASWRLFAGGILREAYATQVPTRVAFVLEAEDLTHAEGQLRGLPLVARGLLTCQLVELRPFVNWSLLFRSPPPPPPP
jgi:hypothetical protein